MLWFPTKSWHEKTKKNRLYMLLKVFKRQNIVNRLEVPLSNDTQKFYHKNLNV